VSELELPTVELALTDSTEEFHPTRRQANKAQAATIIDQARTPKIAARHRSECDVISDPNTLFNMVGTTTRDRPLGKTSLIDDGGVRASCSFKPEAATTESNLVSKVQGASCVPPQNYLMIGPSANN
jgi:hypothetical protein